MFSKEVLINTLINMTQENSNNPNQEKFFFLFLDHFGASFAEAANFNSAEKQNKCFSQVCTNSDEAFGIFSIERCWDKWMTIASGHNQTNCISSDEDGNEYIRQKSNKKYGGLTSAGNKRYSEIAKAVILSRRSQYRKDMEEKYKVSKKNTNDALSLARNSNDFRQEDRELETAYNDLGEISDNDECDSENDTEYEDEDDTGDDESDTEIEKRNETSASNFENEMCPIENWKSSIKDDFDPLGALMSTYKEISGNKNTSVLAPDCNLSNIFSQEVQHKTTSNNSNEYDKSDFEDSDEDDEAWETSKDSPLNKLSPLGQDEKKLDLSPEDPEY